MIMVDERADGRPEVRFAEGHYPRQTLGSDRPDKSFGKRLQIRTPGGYATVPQQISKGGCVERVSVENQVVRVAEEAIVRVGKVPCHLCHPRFVRLTRNTGDLHGAGLELHDEEDNVADESAPSQHFDGEKVRGRKAVPMRCQKCLPGRVRAALRGGSMRGS
jgi:hypothetical protein